jgi:polar amino acid transport system substrate-binding protein
MPTLPRTVALATLAVVAAITALASSAAPARAETITLRGDEWCPYNCVPGSERPGYAVEVAREVFAQAGHEVDYQTLGWARSVADARAGLYAAVIGAIPADAPDFVFPREPIGGSAPGYAVRTGTAFRYEGPSSFAGMVLGAISGYAYDGELGAYVEAHKDDRARVQLASGDDALAQNLKKLAAGRVDVLVDDANVLRGTIAELGLGDRVVVADEGEPVLIYIAFSPAVPGAEERAATLSEGVARMRASGRLAAILARYGLRDWR